MKKIIAIVLTICLAMLCSCGENSSKLPAKEPNTKATTSANSTTNSATKKIL